MFKTTQKLRIKIIKNSHFLTMLALIFNTSFAGVLFLNNRSAGATIENNLCEVPVDLVLIMDRSGSMAAENPSKLSQAQSAANTFLNLMGSSDQSALVYFSYENPTSVWTAKLEKTLSNNHELTGDAVDSLTPYGPTNIGDAIKFANNELGSTRSNPQAVKAAILLTDGKANKPNGEGHDENALDVAYATSEAAIAAANGYKIFTIGLGEKADINETMLEDIANVSGAKYYYAPSGEELKSIYDSIALKICEYGSISGCKFSDSNNDGEITGETKLSGWPIILNNSEAQTQYTDENGCYLFSGLGKGEYTVSEGIKGGETFLQTYPLSKTHIINIASGENIKNADFGNYFPVCGNNITDEGEECDDNNTENSDGCSATCEQEICTAPSGLIINEIMQNPELSSSDFNGEWFELYNSGTSTIDLNGCVISDKGEDAHVISSSLIILAGDYSVLARSASTTLNGGLTPDYVYGSDLTLGNSDDEIAITCCNLIVVDEVLYDGGPSFPDPNGASMMLKNPYLDNSIGGNWCISSSVYGNGDYGTPGTINGTCTGYEPSCGNGIVDTVSETYRPEQCDEGENNGQPGSACSANCAFYPSSISGCKNNDLNNNGVIEETEPSMDGWEIQLIKCPYPPLASGEMTYLSNSILNNSTETSYTTGQCTVVATTITGEGCYNFGDLSGGDYGIREVQKNNWNQTFPINNTFYYFNLPNGRSIQNLDFANHYNQPYEPYCGNEQMDEGEQCDDGNTVNGDGCNSRCQIEESNDGDDSYCGDSKVNPGETCDDGNNASGDGCSSNCNTESSGGGFLRYKNQGEGAISESEEVLVLGEEGAPVLQITKEVDRKFANPGDTGIKYSVIIKNTGNLTAFSVVLTDTLDTNLKYQNELSATKTWAIGDILPGESKNISYLVDINKNALAGIYKNKAVAKANNHVEISASADLEVKKIVVLAETGFDILELGLLSMFSLSLLGVSIFLKRSSY